MSTETAFCRGGSGGRREDEKEAGATSAWRWLEKKEVLANCVRSWLSNGRLERPGRGQETGLEGQEEEPR